MIHRPELIAGIMASSAWLIGQLDEIPNVPGMVSSMTSTGVLIWYLWYQTTRVIPSLTAQFNAELKAQREAFSAEQRASREECNKHVEVLRNALRHSSGS